jgi:hypothetical protein
VDVFRDEIALVHVRACSLMLAHCAGARACTLTETCDVSSLVYMRQHSPFSIASIHVTPEAIMRHWNARAQEYSVAMLMFMHARTVALVLELAACAERSDWVTYLLLYPVMLMVFITCNCTNYIVIVSHEIMHWACASPAAHILQRKVGFTKKTKNGRNIFTDQFVEKSVNHVRRFCGKHLLAGMEHKMVFVFQNLPDIVALTNAQAAFDRGASVASSRITTRPFRLGGPFWLMMTLLDVTNALGELGSDFYTTPAGKSKDGLARNRGGAPPRDKCVRHAVNGVPVSISGERLSLAFLSLWVTGESRSLQLNSEMLAGKPDMQCECHAVKSTAKAAGEQGHKLWVKVHSCNLQQLKGGGK